MTATSLGELSALYSNVSELDLATIRDAIVSEAGRQLLALASTKRSRELDTDEFYAWLIDAMERVTPGTHIWAVSFMLDCEWDDSEPELAFLELNVRAVERGVHIQRVFIVSKETFPRFLKNVGVEAHLNNIGNYMRPLVADHEDLIRQAPEVLAELGDGFIAFDDRVAQIDIHTTGHPIRGIVTMDATEIRRLRVAFDALVERSRELSALSLEASKQSGDGKIVTGT